MAPFVKAPTRVRDPEGVHEFSLHFTQVSQRPSLPQLSGFPGLESVLNKMIALLGAYKKGLLTFMFF
jgi:hypothetical protein